MLYDPEVSGAVQRLGVERLRTVHAELLDLAERGGTEAATSGTPAVGGGELLGEGVSAKKEKKEKKAAKEAAKTLQQRRALPQPPASQCTSYSREGRRETKPAEDRARPSTAPEPEEDTAGKGEKSGSPGVEDPPKKESRKERKARENDSEHSRSRQRRRRRKRSSGEEPRGAEIKRSVTSTWEDTQPEP